MKSKFFRVLPLILCAAAIILACQPPGGPPVTRGSLRITIGNRIAALTIAPPAADTAATLYKVSGMGPSGAKFSTQTGGDPVTVPGLALGQWNISVEALNAKGDTIGRGESSTAVAAGENSITVSVLQASGSGSLSLTVAWNTGQVQGPGSISAVLSPARGGPAPTLSPFNGSDGSLSSTTSGIPPGYYILTLSLRDHAGNVVASTTDLVWIVNAQTSTGGFDFTDAVNTGSVKISITPLPNPLTVSISQSGNTVSAAVANYSGTDLSYQWYRDGAPVGNNSSTYLLPSTPGCSWISVIVWTANWAQAGGATGSFRVGAVQPGIVGSWNFFRAWTKYTGLMQLDENGRFWNWDDLARTIDNAGGTWTMSGNTLTLVFDHGGPGPGSSLTITQEWESADEITCTAPGLPGPFKLYRMGTEPDGYLFNNSTYPPVRLLSGKAASGNLPADGLALYSYTAGPNAQNTHFFWNGRAQIWVFVNEQTTVDPYNTRWVSSPHSAVLTPGQTYSIVVAHQPLLSGDYSILVTDGPMYVGTWTNPAYTGAPPGKFVMRAYEFESYERENSTEPMSIISFALARFWDDAGGQFFQGDAEVTGGVDVGKKMKVLMGVCYDNTNALRLTTSDTDYPTSLDNSISYARQ